MCESRRKWIAATLQLSPGSKLKDRENILTGKSVSGIPDTVLVEAKVALGEAAYRFLCSGQWGDIWEEAQSGKIFISYINTYQNITSIEGVLKNQEE